MRSAPEHLETVLSGVSALEPLEVGLLGSVGLVLAQDVAIADEESEYKLLNKGTQIAPRHVALLAAAGLGRVLVHPMPRVVVLTVGADLSDPGSQDGRTPDINGVALTSAATASGAMTFKVGPLPSNEEILRSALEDQLVRADVILTACGMSADDYELLTSVLNSIGRMEFVKVSMQPGGAQGFGSIGPDATPVFVLPGNPVGALLSFDVFVRPLIRAMMGQTSLHHRVIEATLETEIRSSLADTHYIRAQVVTSGGTAKVRSLEADESHPLAGLGTADALIIVPSGIEQVGAGEKVAVMLLDPQANQ
ncbi:MAG: hypothetical protein EBS36_04905 [Actinobacteria bacterium]|nr:hypothetical protein [Actinomycetota bacterium]NBY15820.1 hypothetical protein [Actinomycetota bacterium]